MNSSKQPRRAMDILLLAIWVFGYHFLIRVFAALQKVERLLGISKASKSGEQRSG